MIRKLTIDDKERTLEYLMDESAFNLFIIGDIENYGMETDFMEIWGEFDFNNKYIGVFLRFFNYFVFYAKDDIFDVDGVDKILKEHGNVEGISGKKSVLDYFMSKTSYDLEEKKDTYFVRLLRKVNEREYANDFEPIKASIEDVEDVSELLNTIVEFGGFSDGAKESLKKEIVQKSGRMYIVREGNTVIATARTAAENSSSAMIVGVATKDEYRNKGLASKCMTKLCREIQSEGKEICLFYDNPKAGSIYRALGFEDLGMWSIIKKIG